MRGTLLGAFGACFLVAAGTFLPASLLSFLGLPTLIISALLIGLGLIPYRKLSRLETCPHEIMIDGNTFLFFAKGKPLLNIPTALIEKIEYVEKDDLYGLGIQLKSGIQKVKVLQRSFDIDAFVSDARSRFSCDLFLPYFTERTLSELTAPLE